MPVLALIIYIFIINIIIWFLFSTKQAEMSNDHRLDIVYINYKYEAPRILWSEFINIPQKYIIF